jgi:hypothetical protein
MSKTKIIIKIVPGFLGLTLIGISSAIGAYCGVKLGKTDGVKKAVDYFDSMKEGKKHE